MAALAAALFLFLPTLTAIALTCETNMTRRSRGRVPRQRGSQPGGSNVDASTPCTRTDRTTKTEDRRMRAKKAAPVPNPGRRDGAAATTTEQTEETNKSKEPPTDRTREDGAGAGKRADAQKKSSGGSSSERLEEKTCQDLAIDAEEADTQENSLDKDALTGTGPGTGPGTGTGTGTGTNAATAGPWPAKMNKTSIYAPTRSSVFDVVGTSKKDDVPSEFELDSVKRLQKMSKETTTQQTTAGSKEVAVEIACPKSPPAPSPKKKAKKKRDRKKEEEVRRWNEAIARGNVFRPRKDDETVDEVHADWGDP